MERLSGCEEKIMNIMWNSDKELAVQDFTAGVHERFGVEWKKQTVSTFLTRLVKKNILEMRREGRLFFYKPLVTKEECKELALKELLDVYFDGDKKELEKKLKSL